MVASLVLRGSFLTVLALGTSLVLNAVTMVVVARGLGPATQGAYAILLLLPTTLVQLGSPGIGVANTYFSGKYRERLAGIFGNSLVLAAVVGTVLATVAVALSGTGLFYRVMGVGGVTWPVSVVMAVAVPLLLLAEYCAGIVRGLAQIAHYNLIHLARAVVQLLAAVVLLHLTDMTLVGAMVAYGVGVLTSSVAALLLVFRSLDCPVAPDWQMFRTVLSYGWKAYFWNFALFLDRRLDLLVLGYLLDATAVGYYSVALGLVEKLWYVPQAVAVVLLPYVAASPEGSRESSFNVTARFARGIGLLLGVGSLLLLVFAVPATRLLFGNSYLPSVPALRALIPSVGVLGVARLLTADLAGRGRPEVGAWCSLVVVGLNLPLDLLLVPRWGIVGASVASSVAYIVAGAVALRLFVSDSGLRVSQVLLIQPSDWRALLSLLRSGQPAARSASERFPQ